MRGRAGGILGILGGLLLLLSPLQAQGASKGFQGRDGFDLAKLRERLAALEAAGGSDSEGEALAKVLRDTIAAIGAGRKLEAELKELKASVKAAPKTRKLLGVELRKLKRSEPVRLESSLRRAGLEEIEGAIAQAKAELATSKEELSQAERLVREAKGRPPKARAELSEAEASLAKLQTRLEKARKAGKKKELDAALLDLLNLERTNLKRRIALLELEIAGNPVLLEVLEAKREVQAARTRRAERRIALLEEKQVALSEKAAENAKLEAERLKTRSLGKHRLLREEAAALGGIARELETRNSMLAALKTREGRERGELERLEADLEMTKQYLELGEEDDGLAALLLEQRRNLPDLVGIRTRIRKDASAKSQVRLRLFRLERSLQELADPAGAADRILLEAGVSGPRAGELREELAKLLASKADLQRRLATILRSCHEELSKLLQVEKDRLGKALELARILDERLIWIRNDPPLSAAVLRSLEKEVEVLSGVESLEGVRNSVTADLERRSFAWIAGFLSFLFLLWLRRRLRPIVDSISPSRQAIADQRWFHPLIGLALVLIQASAFPFLLGLVGFRFEAAGLEGSLVNSVGLGLVGLAFFFFVTELLREIARPRGYGEEFFKWDPKGMAALHRETTWFSLAGGIALFGVLLTHPTSQSFRFATIGRFAFLAGMIALGLYLHRLLSSKRGLVVRVERGLIGGIFRRTRRGLSLLALLFPLGLACISGFGYGYMALQFAISLAQSLSVLLACVLFHSLVFRTLVHSQRSLAIKVMAERRAKEAELEKQDSPVSEEAVLRRQEDRIDLVEVRQQAMDILNLVTGILLAVGFYLSWSHMLPALRFLDEVTIWHYTGVLDGKLRPLPITLGNLCIALLALILTVVAARKMPGFLEMTFLQRLGIDSGTRYATRTLCLYLIVIVGVVVTFNSLGIGWSSIQWLVAALTVGLGFGLQEIFANFVSGLIILLERPIRVGDTVTLGENNGVVTRIRMRATTILDWNLKEIIIPNKNFITGELINWTLSEPTVRLDFLVGIAYGSDTRFAQKLMLDACRAHEGVLDHPEPNVFFVGFGESSLDFEVRVFVTDMTNAGRTAIIHDLHMAIDDKFREHGIVIAFPQRDLHLKSAEAVFDVVKAPAEAGRREPGLVE